MKEKKEKKIIFDLDGCLCTQITDGHYENAQPIAHAVKIVNGLYAEGYTIIIYTARFMNRNKNDIHAVYHEGYEFTRRQLESWNVSYDALIMGKPPADVVIDDRAVFFKPDWEAIDKDIRTRLA